MELFCSTIGWGGSSVTDPSWNMTDIRMICRTVMSHNSWYVPTLTSSHQIFKTQAIRPPKWFQIYSLCKIWKICNYKMNWNDFHCWTRLNLLNIWYHNHVTCQLIDLFLKYNKCFAKINISISLSLWILWCQMQQIHIYAWWNNRERYALVKWHRWSFLVLIRLFVVGLTDIHIC